MSSNKKKSSSSSSPPSRKRPRPRDDTAPSTVTTKNEERVRDIGRKTRQRLNEERSKRKEIVRLDDTNDTNLGLLHHNHNHNPEQRQSKSSSSKFARSVKQTAKLTKRRKTTSSIHRNRRGSSGNNHSSNHSSNRSSNHSKSKIVDLWSPEINHILSNHENAAKGDKSNLVRLHGLPLGVTVNHIRKFFSGLALQRIFLLPSFPVTIKGFDADESVDAGAGAGTGAGADANANANANGRNWNKRKPTVKRYPNHFRVFVKFQSHPIADNAISRSGEAISIIKTNSVDDDDDDDDDDAKVENSNKTNNKHHDTTTIAASIVITPVSKTIATHLQKCMAIDAIVKKGNKNVNLNVQLEDILHETETKIPKIVNELIWAMAKKEVGFDFYISSIGGGGNGSSSKSSHKRSKSLGDSSDIDDSDANNDTSSSPQKYTSTTTTTHTSVYPIIQTHELYQIYPPCTKQEQQKMVILHNHLLDIYEQLEQECVGIAPLLLMREYDHPYLDATIVPEYRIIRTASMWILDQLEIIQKCLVSFHRC